MTIPRRILLLLLLAALLATVHGWITGTAGSTVAEDPYSITLEEVSELEDVIWIDAREEADYEAAHAPGAIRLNEDNWDASLGDLLMQWEPKDSIVVYCDVEACGTSRAVAERLREDLAVEAVYWLKGGWDSLKEVYR